MTASVDEVLREAVEATLRTALPEALRVALGQVLGELRLQEVQKVGFPASGAATPETLHTVSEVARELRVTEPTVRDWIKAGALPARRLGGRGQKRLLRVTRSALDEFKRRHFTDADGVPHPASWTRGCSTRPAAPRRLIAPRWG